MSRHRHAMPFGAELVPGGARFRLWAPSAPDLALHVEGRAPILLERDARGWAEAIVPRVAAGARYRYRAGSLDVPDPASRHQPDGPHGASVVVDPRSYEWRDDGWQPRPWREAVIYELHVGAFTDEGSYRAASARLDDLRQLGVTAIELMPLSTTPGWWNWGYDGVGHFAPSARYGAPDELKAFVDEAHRRGLMVLLDVVYNHFGAEGNYLHGYAREFFDAAVRTPWGDGLDFAAAAVREFVIHNALYWLEEFRFDGLRLDAVDRIVDASELHVLRELAERAPEGRHLTLENDDNAAALLTSDYRAQWNDDVHHALHVLVTGETGGYYRDYAEEPLAHLGRALAEGFAYQGEPSIHRGRRRGEVSTDLPSSAFVSFLQNHDQVGNRAFGDRIHALASAEAVRAATAVVLLAPQIPLLFMGQEWAASSPFPFFCDLGADLHALVRAGRRREVAAMHGGGEAAIPDPFDEATFAASKLRWHERERPEHRPWLDFHRELLAVRAREIVPLLPLAAGTFETRGTVLAVGWAIPGGRLVLTANLSPEIAGAPPLGRIVYATHSVERALPPWFVALARESG